MTVDVVVAAVGVGNADRNSDGGWGLLSNYGMLSCDNTVWIGNCFTGDLSTNSIRMMPVKIIKSMMKWK